MCLITVIYIIKYKKIRYSWPIDREPFYLKFGCTPFDKLVNVDIFIFSFGYFTAQWSKYIHVHFLYND